MDASESSVAEMLVALVALELDAYRQPLGFSNTTLVRFLQYPNAYAPMLLTLLEIVTLLSLGQL